jgi:glycosyltransferase involved in cell wall biosynthesis
MGGASAHTTVVLAVWDEYVGAELTEALDSLRSQDGVAEIVIVDNASTVAVPAPPGARMVHSARRVPLGAARNLGLAEVRTPYVIFWDADDVMLPGTLDFLHAAISADPATAVVGAAIIEAPSGRRHRWPRRWISRLTPIRPAFALLHCMWSLYPTTGATIIRTDWARAAGGFGETDAGEDWCLGVSLAFRGRIRWSERPGRLYRLHDASVWARHMTYDHQVRHARVVRGRLRSDPGVPQWAKLALPLVFAGQRLALLAHLARDRARSGTR